ncbi:MAG: hypothetical protein WHS65_08520 [Melioribacteraceae bacterium]
MKKFLLIIIILITACSSKKNVDEVLRGTFIIKTLPQDDSLETELNKKYFKEILILLHNKFDKEEIKKHLGLNDTEYDEKINFLFANSLIKKKEDGTFVPSCMILDLENQKQIKKISKPIGKIAADIVIDRLPLIKNYYSEHFLNSKEKSSFQKISFEEASLFVLSNVILNKWQLNNIQEKFIKSVPTIRGNKNYYAALFQLKDNDDSVIYFENPIKDFNDSVKVYSKNFYSEKPLQIASKNFTFHENIKLDINKDDENHLKEVASIITKDLIENLDKQKPKLVKYYLNSTYKDETSFREWLSWVYQFIITEATDELIQKGYIKNNSITYSVK